MQIKGQLVLPTVADASGGELLEKQRAQKTQSKIERAPLNYELSLKEAVES